MKDAGGMNSKYEAGYSHLGNEFVKRTWRGSYFLRVLRSEFQECWDNGPVCFIDILNLLRASEDNFTIRKDEKALIQSLVSNQREIIMFDLPISVYAFDKHSLQKSRDHKWQTSNADVRNLPALPSVSAAQCLASCLPSA